MRKLYLSVVVFFAVVFLGACDLVQENELQIIADEISIIYASGDTATAITQDITFENVDTDGIVVTWESNNTAIKIEGNKGVVERGTTDTEVILTVIVTKEDKTAQATYKVVVKGLGSTDVEKTITLVFTVVLPEETPIESDIYLVGDFTEASAIPAWSPDALEGKMTRQTATTATFTLKYERVQESFIIEYKFTRGSWDNVEKDIDNEEINNRILTIDLDNNQVMVNDTVEKWADIDSPVLKTDEDKVAEAETALSFTETEVTADFVLPSLGLHGTTIVWSSNSDAINIDDNIATVNRKNTDVVVTLTATIQLNNITITKSFDVKVIKKSTAWMPHDDIPLAATKVNILEIIQILSTFRFRPEAYQTIDLSASGFYDMSIESNTYIKDDLRHSEKSSSKANIEELQLQLSTLNDVISGKLNMNGDLEFAKASTFYHQGAFVSKTEKLRQATLSGNIYLNSNAVYMDGVVTTNKDGVIQSDNIRGYRAHAFTYEQVLTVYDFLDELINQHGNRSETITEIMNLLENLNSLEVYKMDNRYYVSYQITKETAKAEVFDLLSYLLMYYDPWFDIDAFSNQFDDIIKQSDIALLFVIKDKNIERLGLNLALDMNTESEEEYTYKLDFNSSLNELELITAKVDRTNVKANFIIDIQFNTLDEILLPSNLDTYEPIAEILEIDDDILSVNQTFVDIYYVDDHHPKVYYTSEFALKGTNIWAFVEAYNDHERFEIIDLYYDDKKEYPVAKTDVFVDEDIELYIGYQIIEEPFEVRFIYENGQMLEFLDALPGEIFDRYHIHYFDNPYWNQAYVIYRDQEKQERLETRGIYESGTYYVFSREILPSTLTIENDYGMSFESFEFYDEFDIRLSDYRYIIDSQLDEQFKDRPYYIEGIYKGRTYKENDRIVFNEDATLIIVIKPYEDINVQVEFYYDNKLVYIFDEPVYEGISTFDLVEENFPDLKMAHEMHYYNYTVSIDGDLYNLYDLSLITDTNLRIDMTDRKTLVLDFNVDIEDYYVFSDNDTYTDFLQYLIRLKMEETAYSEYLFHLYADSAYQQEVVLEDNIEAYEKLYVKIFDQAVTIEFNLVSELDLDVEFTPLVTIPTKVNIENIRRDISSLLTDNYWIDLRINELSLYEYVLIEEDTIIDVYVFEEPYMVTLNITYIDGNELIETTHLDVLYGTILEDAIYDNIKTVLGHDRDDLRYINIDAIDVSSYVHFVRSDLDVQVIFSAYEKKKVTFVLEDREINGMIHSEYTDYLVWGCHDFVRDIILKDVDYIDYFIFVDSDFKQALTRDSIDLDAEEIKVYVKVIISGFVNVSFGFDSTDFDMDIEPYQSQHATYEHIFLNDHKYVIYQWLEEKGLSHQSVLIETYVNDQLITDSHFLPMEDTQVTFVVKTRPIIKLDYKVFIDNQMIDGNLIDIPYGTTVYEAQDIVYERLLEKDINGSHYDAEIFYTRNLINMQFVTDSKMHLYLTKLEVETVEVVINGILYEFYVVQDREYQLEYDIRSFIDMNYGENMFVHYYLDEQLQHYVNLYELFEDLPERVYVVAFEDKTIEIEINFEYNGELIVVHYSYFASRKVYLSDLFEQFMYNQQVFQFEELAAQFVINGITYEDYEAYRFYENTVISAKIIQRPTIIINTIVSLDGISSEQTFEVLRGIYIDQLMTLLFNELGKDAALYDLSFSDDASNHVFYEDSTIIIEGYKKETKTVLVVLSGDLGQITVEYPTNNPFYIWDKIYELHQENFIGVFYEFYLFKDEALLEEIEGYDFINTELEVIYVLTVVSNQTYTLQLVFDEAMSISPKNYTFSAFDYIYPSTLDQYVSDILMDNENEGDYIYTFINSLDGKHNYNSIYVIRDYTFLVEVKEPSYYTVKIHYYLDGVYSEHLYTVREQSTLFNWDIINYLDESKLLPLKYSMDYDFVSDSNIIEYRVFGDVEIIVTVEDQTQVITIYIEGQEPFELYVDYRYVYSLIDVMLELYNKTYMYEYLEANYFLDETYNTPILSHERVNEVMSLYVRFSL